MTYTVQASDHPEALAHPGPAEAVASWVTVFDGPIYSDGAARGLAEEIGRGRRYVRAFKHSREIGHLWYVVADGSAVAI